MNSLLEHCTTTVETQVIVATRMNNITSAQLPNEVAGKHCSTVISDDPASTTCVMWCEEHLWNVSVLQRVHLVL
jgi:hypothetical protein